MAPNESESHTDKVYHEAKELFLATVEMDPTEREQFLTMAAAGNPSLQSCVRNLWRAEEEFLISVESSRGQALDGLPSVLGNFRILEHLGGGGMGSVFLALDPRNNLKVALKVIHAGAVFQGLHQRFQREISIIRQLDHPGIVRLYEAGMQEAEGGDVAYLAMEYIQGRPLDRYCEETPFNLRQRLKLLAQIAQAVAHAHERGIVHRDLKPANILVDEEGRPRVLDFGVSRIFQPSETLHTLTIEGSHLIGTIKYMSPEMAQGAEANTASDIYALGLIIHTTLTGHFPYPVPEYPLHQALLAVIAAKPKVPSRHNQELGPEVDAVVARCLALDPGQRYGSAQDLAEDLEALSEGGNLHVDVPGPGRRFLQRLRSRVPGVSIWAALVPVFGLLVWILLANLDGARTVAPPSRSSIYALLDSADNNLHIAPRGHDGYLAAVDSLSRAIDLLKQRRDLPEFNVLNQYARWRMGEAQFFLGGLEFDPARYQAANQYFASSGDVPFDREAYAALDSTSVVTPRIGRHTRYQAYGGRALVAAALANYVSPHSYYRLAQAQIKLALALISDEATAMSYEADTNNLRINMCRAYNDNGRYWSLWGAAGDSPELVRTSLAWFARSDSIGNIRHDPDAHGSLLQGWGRAHLLLAEMGGDTSAQARARRLLRRACSVQEEAGLRQGFLNSRVLLARANRLGWRMGLSKDERERDMLVLQRLAREDLKGCSPFAASRLQQELAEQFLARFDSEGSAHFLEEASLALSRAADLCPRQKFVFEAKRRLPTEARLALRMLRAKGGTERAGQVLDQVEQALAGNLQQDDRRLFNTLSGLRRELNEALGG